MVFNLPGLNRVSNLVRVCPNYKQGITRLHIQVRVNSQTKGLERGWKRGARLERDAKSRSRGRVRFLSYAMPILRKKANCFAVVASPPRGHFWGSSYPVPPHKRRNTILRFFLQNIACEQAYLGKRSEPRENARASYAKQGQGFKP